VLRKLCLERFILHSGDKSQWGEGAQRGLRQQKYDLLPAYASLWDAKTKNTKESIFEIQYLGGSATSPYSNYYLEFFPNSNALGFYGAGMNQVVDDIWNEYEKGDGRREASIDTGFTDAKGNFTKTKFPKKWQDKTAPLINQKHCGQQQFHGFALR
jgi:hypothetical protein